MKIKAFSILELLVVMGIVAILSALAAFGIGQLNKASRDGDRLNTLGQMVDILNAYKRTNLNYPRTENVTFDEGFAIDNEIKLELEGFKQSGFSTTDSQTKYEYQYSNGRFGLCAVMESGNIENVGDFDIDCQ